jgi:hypothetical protein
VRVDALVTTPKGACQMDLFFLRRTLSMIAMDGALALTPELVCAAGAAPLDVAVNFQPDGTKGENAAWLGYVLARAHFVDDHHSLYEQKPGPITPTFTEELTARTDAVKIYREMLAKDSTLDVPYHHPLTKGSLQFVAGKGG